MAIVEVTASGTFTFSDSNTVSTVSANSVSFKEGHRLSRFGNFKFGQTQHGKINNADINTYDRESDQTSPTWTKVN